MHAPPTRTVRASTYPTDRTAIPRLPALTASSKQNAEGDFMRILITNDDGINAPGLEVLTEIATAIAGPQGEVWTVAPAFEQSGVGH